MTLNKVIAGALYIVICGWNAVKVQGWQLTVKWRLPLGPAFIIKCVHYITQFQVEGIISHQQFFLSEN